MTTGEKIKFLRTQLNMSQEELGEKIGVKKAAIHKYETGVVINLKRSTISKLANALNTTPAYLMGWEKTNTPNTETDAEGIELLKQIKQLSPEKQKQLLDYARFLSDRKED